MKKCKQCGITYQPKSSKSLYCSNACKQSHHRMMEKIKGFGLLMTARGEDELSRLLDSYGYNGNEFDFYIHNKHNFY